MSDLVACVDVGSTVTKALLVDVGAGELVGTAQHRTTIDTDVVDGWLACRAELAARVPAAAAAPVLACSSAGGGLRVAVVGNEELVTAEAGRRVSLSSGGVVVRVSAGALTADGVAELRTSKPDVVLLVGGTDGGNSAALIGAAESLAAARWPGPVVVAGNSDAADEAASRLADAGVDHVVADNVVPRIGELRPEPARRAIREVFLSHVIGGKRLSASAEFVAMVQGATPDVILGGVELLAEAAGNVAVVDVGGATTDVHSVVELDPEDAGLSRDVVAATPVTRTVEGDLGMRWSAPTTVARAAEAGMVAGADAAGDRWDAAADRRRRDPSWLPRDATDIAAEYQLATAAVGLAMRRHAGRQRVAFGPDGRVVEREGVDLRAIDLLVGSGGVLRHASSDRADAVLREATGEDIPGGWLLPRDPRIVVDRSYVLAAAGLLRADYPDVARALTDLEGFG